MLTSTSSVKIANIFWTNWGNSMKFSGKMWLMIILKATKNPGIHPLCRRYSFGKTTERKGSSWPNPVV